MTSTSEKIRLFTVSIYYCDQTEFEHENLDRREACEEYAQLMFEAIEPTMPHPEARHIRLLTLTAFDKDGLRTQKTHTPVFPCVHKP